MTDKEVLYKAIDKISTLTIDEGVSKLVIANEETFWIISSIHEDKDVILKEFIGDVFYDHSEWDEITNEPKPDEKLYGFIFHHEFAKAFWGEELLFIGTPLKDLPEDDPSRVFKTKDLCQQAWRYHLIEMVLYPNPIDYLRQFIDNTEKPESK